MDTLESVHQKRATKHTKTKKKPVRVVYISNPMRVKTSASEFMALVQELTGQDAELPDPTKFSGVAAAANDVVGGNQMVVVGMKEVANNDDDDEDHAIVEVPIVVDHGSNSSLAPSMPHLNFEPFDHEVFTPQMLENFTGLLPSSLFYEPL